MLKFWKELWQEEDGMGTVEVVLIVTALVIIAVLLTTELKDWVGVQVKTMFDGT